MQTSDKRIKRYAYTLVAIISVWLYVTVVNEELQIIDVPMFVWALVLAGLIVLAHLKLGRNKDGQNIDKPGSVTGRAFTKVVFVTMFGLVFSMVLAYLTTVVFQEERRHELTSLFTTCESNPSAVKVLSTDSSMTLANGAIVTVNTVAHNVPQLSGRPLDNYSGRCTEATIVEITVDNIPRGTDTDTMSTYNFILRGVAPLREGKISEIRGSGSIEKYDTGTLNKGDLKGPRFVFMPEGKNSSHGWLVFPVAANSSNESPVLLYEDDDGIANSIKIPADY